MKKHLALCLLLSVSLTASLYAQPAQQTVKSIRFEQLPENMGRTIDIVQDHQGFMWFAGGYLGGLYKYDGYQVTNYEYNSEDDTSLTDQWVECLLVDRQGTLWVGIWGGGLNLFDPSTETFSRYQAGSMVSLSDKSITVLLEDREGTIWIGTELDGLYRFDLSTDTLVHYRHEPDEPTSLSYHEVRAIYEDRQGTLWIGTGSPMDASPDQGGLNRYDPTTGTFIRYQHDPEDEHSLINNWVWALYEDSRGTFWVGTNGDGLHAMDRETGKFTRYSYDPENPSKPSMPHLRRGPYPLDPVAGLWAGVTFVHEDGSGKRWIGGQGGGIDVYDPETETVTHYESNPNDPNSLGNNDIYEIFESRDGTIWIGTWGRTYKAVPSVRGYTSYQSDQSDANSLSYDHVWGLHEDREGIVWIGTDGGELNRFDPVTGAFTLYRHNPDDPFSLGRGGGLGPIVDPSGVLWVLNSEGFDRFDRDNDRFVHYRYNPEDSLSLSFGTLGIAWPAVDSQGTIWVLSRGYGLNRLLDPEVGTVKRFRYDEADTTSLSSDVLTCFYEDRAGTLWFCTTNGLNRFNPNDETFTRLLGGRSTMTIHEDEVGRFFVGTDGEGLILLDRNTGESRHFTTEDGLPSDRIAGIVEDEEGFLWISSNQVGFLEPRGGRITRFDPEAETFSTFGPEDGLPDIGFHTRSSLRRRDGTLMFGGFGGLISIDPKTFGTGGELIPPTVVLTEFRLFNDRVIPGEEGPLREPIYLTEDIVLLHRQNDFMIDYTGLSYRDPGETRYRYMLENHDEDWVEARTQRSARYSGMEPGAYIFRVRAVSGRGVWSEEDAIVAITILPPWWRTGWAYALWALLLVGAVVGSFRVQRARIVRKEREQAQIREVELRAETAELQAKASDAQARTLEVENERNRLEVEKVRELEKAYNKLKTTQNQLIQSEKMASLGELTAGIAHEIKNPLNFVNNFAEVNEELANELKEILEGNMNSRVTDIIEDLDEISSSLSRNNKHISKHGKRADSIVNSMMQHAHVESENRYRVEVNRLVDENIGLSYHGMRAQYPDLSVEIEKSFDETVGNVEMVPQDIGRVLINVLNNAFYVVHKKKQSVKGSYEPKVSVTTQQVENGVEVRVQDNGPGIPEEVIERIFEPFFTTKPTGTGTGLGLSLSYDIVTQGHGGTIRVKSEEGEGATFIITLPVSQ